MLTEMLMYIWKVERYHYSICYSPRADYDIKTTLYPHMRYPLANTPESSAPIMIYECISAQEKLYFALSYEKHIWDTHLFHIS